MTTQSAIATQSFGTGSNTGENKFSISPLTLGASTTAYVVSIQVTRGATTNLDPQNAVRVFYTTTMRTVASADAPYKLAQTARYVDILLDRNSLISIKDSSLEPVTGSNFHCWVTSPTLNAAATLDVDLIELP